MHYVVHNCTGSSFQFYMLYRTASRRRILKACLRSKCKPTNPRIERILHVMFKQNSFSYKVTKPIIIHTLNALIDWRSKFQTDTTEWTAWSPGCNFIGNIKNQYSRVYASGNENSESRNYCCSGRTKSWNKPWTKLYWKCLKNTLSSVRNSRWLELMFSSWMTVQLNLKLSKQ